MTARALPNTRDHSGLARKALGTLLAATALIAANAVGVRAAQASPASPGTWSAPKTIPGSSPNGPIALAQFQKHLYAAWVDHGDPGPVGYSFYNSKTKKWTTPATVPSSDTLGPGVGLSEYGGKLYVAWTGTTSPYHLLYSVFNGKTWSAPATEPVALTTFKAYPSLTVFDSSLYMSWIGQSAAAAVWYASFNGTSWSSQASIPGSASCTCSPSTAAIVEYKGDLYAAWASSSDDQTVYARYDGTWSTSLALASDTFVGVDAATFGGNLYVAWYESPGGDVYQTFNGTTWSSSTLLPPGADFESPGLASFNGKLYAAWEGYGPTVEYASGP